MKKCQGCGRFSTSDARICYHCGGGFSQYSGAERRRTERVRANLPLRFRAPLADYYYVSPELTLTKDISAGGVLFSTQRNLPVGTEMEVRLRLPTATEDMRLRARAVRVEEVAPREWYEIGISFLGLKPRDELELTRYVEYKKENLASTSTI